ncbi:hypothetical protein U1Q18_017775, partial [Sarracenia purpurea var. burkii]
MTAVVEWLAWYRSSLPSVETKGSVGDLKVESYNWLGKGVEEDISEEGGLERVDGEIQSTAESAIPTQMISVKGSLADPTIPIFGGLDENEGPVEGLGKKGTVDREAKKAPKVQMPADGDVAGSISASSIATVIASKAEGDGRVEDGDVEVNCSVNVSNEFNRNKINDVSCNTKYDFFEESGCHVSLSNEGNKEKQIGVMDGGRSHAHQVFDFLPKRNRLPVAVCTALGRENGLWQNQFGADVSLFGSAFKEDQLPKQIKGNVLEEKPLPSAKTSLSRSWAQ